MTLHLEIPGLPDGAAMPLAHVYNDFGCTGGNRSPALRWRGVPDGTKSLALTCYDPDAPTGSGWWHWVVFNLPPSLTELPENASAAGLPTGAVQSITDYGAAGYGGAAPPPGHGDHRYIFTLYALDTDALPLDAAAMPAMVGFFIHQHKLASASVTLLYGR
jgi:Raf kinase inhibitor-like YbhB/YbcL family protein